MRSFRLFFLDYDFNAMRSLKSFIFVSLVIFTPLNIFAQSVHSSQAKGNSLVLVGDSALNYASYLFILPYNWIPLAENQELTNERGFWKGKLSGGQAWVQIVPTRKESGQGLADFVRAAKEESEKDGGCASGALKEYTSFTPSIKYPYEVYSLSDCPKGKSGILVFVDLPQHVILFNLYGQGDSDKSLNYCLEDFSTIISTFRWILGLSKDQIGEAIKSL